MLPVDAPEARAAVTEAEALRQLLLRRQQISEAADWLDRQPRLGLDAFTRAGWTWHHLAGQATSRRCCALAWPR
jgi:hypothetical protein